VFPVTVVVSFVAVVAVFALPDTLPVTLPENVVAVIIPVTVRLPELAKGAYDMNESTYKVLFVVLVEAATNVKYRVVAEVAGSAVVATADAVLALPTREPVTVPFTFPVTLPVTAPLMGPENDVAVICPASVISTTVALCKVRVSAECVRSAALPATLPFAANET
jgi:hypothetical protein